MVINGLDKDRLDLMLTDLAEILGEESIQARVGRRGLRNLTRAMTAEWAAHGLQINAIAPGYIHTGMTQSLVDDDAFSAWILGRTPANRWGQVEGIVGPTVWLASEASNYVNGQTIFVDGGMSVVA